MIRRLLGIGPDGTYEVPEWALRYGEADGFQTVRLSWTYRHILRPAWRVHRWLVRS